MVRNLFNVRFMFVVVLDNPDHIPGEANAKAQARGFWELGRWRGFLSEWLLSSTLHPGDQRPDHPFPWTFRYVSYELTAFFNVQPSELFLGTVCVFCRKVERLQQSGLARTRGVSAHTAGRPHYCCKHLAGCVCQKYRVSSCIEVNVHIYVF